MHERSPAVTLSFVQDISTDNSCEEWQSHFTYHIN